MMRLVFIMYVFYLFMHPDVDLLKTVFDLFSAGFDTTSNMLRWVILYMAAYPQVQLKVQEELDEAVPRDTLPSHQHRHRSVFYFMNHSLCHTFATPLVVWVISSLMHQSLLYRIFSRYQRHGCCTVIDKSLCLVVQASSYSRQKKERPISW